jgi:hypothetical protein
MTRHVTAHVAELHVECAPAAVGEERLLVEAINPGAEKRDAAHARTRRELLDRAVRPDRLFWPFTFISQVMLPTDGRIETTVCVRASLSRTTSPLRSDEYGCANAAVPTRGEEP